MDYSKKQPSTAPIKQGLKKEENSIKKARLDKIAYYIGTMDWDTKIAFAVMMAESDGVLKAYNDSNSDKTDDKGIWQINSIHKIADECSYDIECSTDFAYKLSKGGTNWTPWVAYNNGSYKEHL